MQYTKKGIFIDLDIKYIECEDTRESIDYLGPRSIIGSVGLGRTSLLGLYSPKRYLTPIKVSYNLLGLYFSKRYLASIKIPYNLLGLYSPKRGLTPIKVSYNLLGLYSPKRGLTPIKVSYK
ncbi:hypothetical protein GQ44DRAFT_727861 [Phaeosphaeriaceae sp. PMI808]|nr:hypothetical protein GQ44DRAFT_727861 [Phaeosphaeriaceae sp. PMI808]